MLSRQGFHYKICLIGLAIVIVAGNKCTPNYCNSGQCKETEDGNINCICKHGWKGLRCDENINDCASRPCKNGGICIDEINSRYNCNCTEEYIGRTCEFLNPCRNKNPCKNGGKCEPIQDGKHQCICQNSFTGEFCESRKIICPTNLNESREMCNYNGLCLLNELHELSCKCDDGYVGKHCEVKINSGIQMNCKNYFCYNGECILLKDGSPKCKCLEGFSGDRCKLKLDETERSKIGNLKLEENNISLNHSKSEGNCDSRCKQLIGNGICNMECNTRNCRYDDGDCDPWKKCSDGELRHCKSVFNNGHCNPECNSVDCLFDGEDCQKSLCQQEAHCSKVFQNKVCNEECNNPQCGFDGGDCHTKSINSFFSGESFARCSSQTKIFELDLILMTSLSNFAIHKSEFMRRLSAALRMVVTITKIKEIDFNYSKALQITLHVNHTQCILYGGKCFSTLDQISNFIKAGIPKGNTLSLPFRVARVDTNVIRKHKPISTNSPNAIIFGAIGFGLLSTFVLVVVLLRDKWGKMRTRIKTAGTWVPSDGYSTSTSSIDSEQKIGWSNLPQMNEFKNDYKISSKFIYGDNYLIDQKKMLRDGNEEDKINANYKRKRKHDTSNDNNKASSFQFISDCFEINDGVHPVDTNYANISDIIAAKMRLKSEEKYQNTVLDDIGDYVNENGESLMHIAARMNCGQNLIKQLNSISPSMLQSLDEWGRTPLATSIAADAVESASQLILLEKQLRKESKQNKSRLGIGSINSGVSCEYLVRKTTALIESVKLDSMDLISLLLDEGNPVNVLDTHGRSVVHWGAMFNNVTLLERLSHMKIFQKLADLKDNEDKSPLYFAANEGSLKCVKFLLEYFDKSGIKIDSNCPCPKMIADEKGFYEIRDLIHENLRRATLMDKSRKRTKLRESKLKLQICENPTSDLCIIDEYKELTCNSIENMPNSSGGNESIDSCLLELYSITDTHQNNQELKLFSSFKPNECKYQEYQSNTSSSDMSPPLLNLNNSHFQNGFNSMTYSDPNDPNFSTTLFLSPTSLINQPDLGCALISQEQSTNSNTEFRNVHISPQISKYSHRSTNHSNILL